MAAFSAPNRSSICRTVEVTLSCSPRRSVSSLEVIGHTACSSGGSGGGTSGGGGGGACGGGRLLPRGVFRLRSRVLLGADRFGVDHETNSAVHGVDGSGFGRAANWPGRGSNQLPRGEDRDRSGRADHDRTIPGGRPSGSALVGAVGRGGRRGGCAAPVGESAAGHLPCGVHRRGLWGGVPA